MLYLLTLSAFGPGGSYEPRFPLPKAFGEGEARGARGNRSLRRSRGAGTPHALRAGSGSLAGPRPGFESCTLSNKLVSAESAFARVRSFRVSLAVFSFKEMTVICVCSVC